MDISASIDLLSHLVSSQHALRLYIIPGKIPRDFAKPLASKKSSEVPDSVAILFKFARTALWFRRLHMERGPTHTHLTDPFVGVG